MIEALCVDALRQALTRLGPLTVVGIDPGISGAVVEVTGKTIRAIRDFKSRRDIARAVQKLVPGASLVVIEKVHAMPGEGVCSVFSFGKSTGVAFGAVDCNYGPDPVEVAPQAWQNCFKKLLGIPQETRFKTITQEVASRLWPGDAALFRRKKDHNTADAALIAAWGALNFDRLTAKAVLP